MRRFILYITIIGVIVSWLSLWQQEVYAASPPSVIKTQLYEKWYLEVLYNRKVLVLEDAVFYAEQDENLPVLGKLSSGTTIDVIGSNYYVSPTKVIVLEDHIAKCDWPTPTKFYFKAGEVFYIVNYLGEGIFNVWRENEMFRVDLRGIKGLSVYGTESNYWGMLVEDAKWHQGKAWTQIKTDDGQLGWVVWGRAFGNTKIDGYREIYVFINGKYISEFPSYGNNSYKQEEGKILLSLETTAKLIGASVIWNSDSTIATIKYKSNSLKIIPGKRIAILNGNPIDMEFAPNWRGNTFFVPFQKTCEYLGGKFEWNEDARKISIELVETDNK